MTSYFLGLLGIFCVAISFFIQPLRIRGWAKWGTAGGIGLISLVAYFSLGGFSLHTYQYRHPELMQFYYALEKPALPLKEYKLLADQAARTLGNSSQDVAGWQLLSEFYLAIDDVAAAETSLAQAHAGAPSDQQIATQYAQVSFSAQKGVFKENIVPLLISLVKNDPNNQQASLLLAMSYSQQKEYAKALALWRRLERQMSPGSLEATLIQRGIEKAERLLQESV